MEKNRLLLIAFLGCMISCNSAGHLARYYTSIKTTKEQRNSKDSLAYLSVNAYSIPSAKPQVVKPKNILDLSPEAQAALITAMNGKDSIIDTYIAALSNFQIGKEMLGANIVDNTKFEKRIIFAIRNLDVHPANRISKIEIEMLPTANVQLVSCTKVSSDFTTIDLSALNIAAANGTDITRSGSSSLSLGNALSDSLNSNGLSKLIGKASNLNNVSANRSLSESVSLKQRVVVLNAALINNTLSLYQASFSPVDLTGNIVVDVVLVANDIRILRTYSFSNFIDSGQLSNPENIKIMNKITLLPKDNNVVTAKVSFTSDYRKVLKGGKTISEADDRIRIIQQTKANVEPFILIPKDELVPKLYQISILRNDHSRSSIGIGSDKEPLLFNTFADANNFLLWLQAKYVKDSITTLTDFGEEKYTLYMPSPLESVKSLQVTEL